jgi:hypothetical protein
MMTEKHSVDLTPQELDVIQSALQTQEKILSVQSRASGDGTVANRLGELKGVLNSLRRQTPKTRPQSWFSMARTLFG